MKYFSIMSFIVKLISLFTYSYYCPANGSSSERIECPVGHYCPTGTHLQNQHPCPAGTINPHTRMTGHEDCLPCPPGTISGSNSTPIESFLRVTHLLFSEGHAALFLHSRNFQLQPLVLSASVKTQPWNVLKTFHQQVSSASLLDGVLCLDRVQRDTFVSQEPRPPHPWMEGQVINVLKDTTVL